MAVEFKKCSIRKLNYVLLDFRGPLAPQILALVVGFLKLPSSFNNDHLCHGGGYKRINFFRLHLVTTKKDENLYFCPKGGGVTYPSPSPQAASVNPALQTAALSTSSLAL